MCQRKKKKLINNGLFNSIDELKASQNKMIDIQRRNRAIRQYFYELLEKNIPIMLAYAMTGEKFYLGEERIRQIIAKRNC